MLKKFMEKEKITESVCQVLAAIRERSPLVLSMTNTVVQPITANALLAIGAVPAMLCDGGEAAEMINACANAVLINTGTLSREQADAMRTAIRAAHDSGTAWVLDPVAVGLLSFRTQFIQEILSAGTPPALIRGNASEILALAGYDAKPRGPESTVASDDACEAAKKLAQKIGGIVLVTGKTDFISDGNTLYAFENGHALMTRVTGIGCAMGALCAACVAVAKSPLEGAIAATVLIGIAGELAAEQSSAPGTFSIAFLDALNALDEKIIAEKIKIKNQ